ncbi:Rv0909 family putative TA system antitoxin [Actinomyces weissii]|uniref:Antitoxin n=1 Tax=Actinomyces weissii TaxID=675090 RepID=A0A7T7S206_9ACTO|nr:Rv0909 family putative TA system antitoxin [Actinomyces weissii]QQM67501.1 antitoxin [Actinomyces weissii]
MGLEDLKNKAAELVDAEKIETATDKALDAAGGLAKKVTGGKFDDKIDAARDAADKAIGQ